MGDRKGLIPRDQVGRRYARQDGPHHVDGVGGAAAPGGTVKPTAEVTFEVPFHDVDLMEVCWHGHYYKYFELARTALFRKYACDVPQLREMGYSLPVIDSQCRYISPLRYGMQVVARATLVESEYRLKVNYLLCHAADGKRLARGSTVQVAVQPESQNLCLVTPKAIVALFGETLQA